FFIGIAVNAIIFRMHAKRTIVTYANISSPTAVIAFDMELVYHIRKAPSPIIAAAIHDGHLLAEPLLDYMHLQEHERFREEDPYTAYLANVPTSRILVQTSRFQTDLNRRREKAVYREPDDAWGLTVWQPALPAGLVAQDRKSTRLNSSHVKISYAVFCSPLHLPYFPTRRSSDLRFREEDPYTAYLANVPTSRILVQTSRFQTDLNRRREKAVYREPDDAWGLTVWQPALPAGLVA